MSEGAATTAPVGAASPESDRRLLAGDALKAAAAEYEKVSRAKVLGPQRGIVTFFDAAVHDLLKILRSFPSAAPWERAVREASLPEMQRRYLVEAFDLFRAFLSRRSRGRFVEHAERRAASGVEIPHLVQKMSQGTDVCLSWKGLPLFKSVFDFAIYPMLLSEVKPRTLFEIGAGTGASASWLVDLVGMLELDTRIYSLDLVQPELEVPEVRFLQGDCNQIASAIPPSLLAAAPHPWVVIEDAHVNVLGVLEHFGSAAREGDYFVVEDSKDKVRDLAAFCDRNPRTYGVDTRYTDFFGKNCTTAHDSILRRMTD